MLLQAMQGLQQDPPRGKLYVDPALPDWLPNVTLTDLRLGGQRFDIRVWRDGKDTLFKVLTGKRDSVEWRSVALSARTGVCETSKRLPRWRNPWILSSGYHRYARKQSEHGVPANVIVSLRGRPASELPLLGILLRNSSFGADHDSQRCSGNKRRRFASEASFSG